MGYFRELPNLRYPSFLPEKTSSLDYVEVKNIFRRAKLRDDLQNNFTVFDKYGESLNSVRFFETKEVKDTNGRLILPKGKVVDSNFTIPKPGEPTATLNPVTGISNYEYEVRLNEEKRNIFVLREEYLQEFLSDMRDLMIYNESSEYLNDKVIQTDNTNITLP